MTKCILLRMSDKHCSLHLKATSSYKKLQNFKCKMPYIPFHFHYPLKYLHPLSLSIYLSFSDLKFKIRALNWAYSMQSKVTLLFNVISTDGWHGVLLRKGWTIVNKKKILRASNKNQNFGGRCWGNWYYWASNENCS